MRAGYFPPVDAATFCEHVAELVPVFTAPPGEGPQEYRRPAGWQQTTRERNAERLACAEEDYARMALMGDLLAAVDVDTKNGADVERTRQTLEAIGVRIYADVLTPSGGRHFYVAGHRDLPTVHARDGKPCLVGHPGVEIISHGANVFLPGTKRLKYDGAGYVVVSDDLGTLLDGGDPDSAEALVAWVAEHRVSSPATFEPSQPWTGKPPDHREHQYLEAVLRGTYERLSAMGRDSGRNTSLYNAAMGCGNYIAGAGMDEARAIQTLRAACETNGLTAEDGQPSVDATIASGLLNGKARPRAVPPSKEATYLTELADSAATHPTPVADPAGGDDQLEAALDAAALFQRLVDEEAHKIRVREAARDLIAREKAADQPPFDAGTLAEILERPESPPHRVEELVPSGASALIVAQKKTGKTTLVLNLARCLIEGGEFLGRFATRPVAGRVAILNYEVTGEMLARWADEVGVPTDRLVLVNLRGRRNPLRVEEDRAKLAALLRELEVEALIVDPFGRAYGGKSQNDAAEVGQWLVDLDTFTRSEVGAAEVYLCAHAGWTAERTRGSSALEDWPDVTITLTRDQDNHQVRYLAAEGRDVLLEEDRLDFNPTTRELTLSGGGSRRQAKAQKKTAELSAAVVEVVTERPGLNTRELSDELRTRGHAFQRGDVGRAASSATTSGHLRQEHGPRNSTLYFPKLAVVPSSPDPSPRDGLSSPDPSYRGRDYSEDYSALSGPGTDGAHQ